MVQKTDKTKKATDLVTRVSEACKNELVGIYGNAYRGNQIAVENYLIVRAATLRELKGIFTKAELTGIVSSYNGTMLVPEYMTKVSMFTGHLEDAEKYESVISTWKADINSIVEKANKLSAAQVFFLQEEIAKYWGDPASTIELFTAKFV